MSNLVTPEDVYNRVTVTVDHLDVARAQAVIGDAVELDLGDALAVAPLEARDLAAIKSAIIWEVAYLDEHPEVLTQQGNVSNVNSNGSGMSFRSGELGAVSPLAQRCLDGLSWNRKGFAVQTLRPNRRSYERRPDPWQRVR